MLYARTLTVLAACITASLAHAQCIPQAARLVGDSPIGATSNLGRSCSISADGSTAIVGAFSDNTNVGAAYIFTRVAGVWAQQGPKLTATGEVGAGQFGISVSICGDGNTAVIGAQADSTNVGAAFIFTRTAGVWGQLGNKLTATGALGAGQFGASVSISADGSTILVGANADNSNVGAGYFFIRGTGDVWTAQGGKLTPTGAGGAGQFGRSVALSADGNTALVGANTDASSFGAGYVFTRAAGHWTQQGSKLTPIGGVGSGQMGRAVAVSADGNTAALGAFADNSSIGAVYMYSRTGSTWALASKLVPASSPPLGQFGISVSLRGDSALFGANNDNTGAGAAYLFSHASGAWIQQGGRLLATGAIGAGQFGLSVALSTDLTTALIGAQSDNTNVGAAYIFDINPVTAITQQPAPASSTGGGGATFTVAAASDYPLSYQWRRNGVTLTDGPAATGATIAGAMTNSLTLTDLTAQDNGGAFDCLITGPCSTITSSPAGLVVNAGCGSADFNNDGDAATDADIEAFFRVLAGGNC